MCTEMYGTGTDPNGMHMLLCSNEYHATDLLS